MKKLVYILIITIAIISCSPNKEIEADSLSFEEIMEGHMSYSGPEEIQEQYVVLENQVELNNFIPVIENASSNLTQELEDLDFDFSNNNLIIVIGKWFSYCCSEITIERIYKNNEEVIVDFSETGPGIAAALSQAYLIIKIAKD